uniref:Vascular endothelial growth factor C n=1 Tax=Poecilia mexicana TaxID=48701 RepID=A0A3B3Y7H5_9TELE
VCVNSGNEITVTQTSHEFVKLQLPEPDMEQKLRSASSVDELMSLIYPSYWAALKCRSKLSAAASSASKFTQRPQTHRLRPLSEAQEPTYAAAYLNLDVLKSIELEWRKTQCMPREVCVDVGREFGAPTNVFYKPPCVSVYRCGGCCPSEDKQCRNISTGYLSKTLFEITVPLTQGTKPVTISVANHTQCSCLSKLDIYRQVHSIIRRALPDPDLNLIGLAFPGCIVGRAAALQQEGSGFNSQPGSFCMDFACSPCACVGFLWVLRFPPTDQKHDCQVIGLSKLSLGVCVCMVVCLCAALRQTGDLSP